MRLLHRLTTPLWLDPNDPDFPLAGLTVAGGEGQWFPVTPAEWARVLMRVGGWPLSTPSPPVRKRRPPEPRRRYRPRGAQQGVEWNAAVRHCVERYAIARVAVHLRGCGWIPVDVSDTTPYELLCTKDGEPDLHVAVKGTRGAGRDVDLSRNEVRHARGCRHVALYVVAGMTVSLNANRQLQAHGGIVRRPWWPWEINAGAPTVKTYDYKPPGRVPRPWALR